MSHMHNMVTLDLNIPGGMRLWVCNLTLWSDVTLKPSPPPVKVKQEYSILKLIITIVFDAAKFPLAHLLLKLKLKLLITCSILFLDV